MFVFELIKEEKKIRLVTESLDSKKYHLRANMAFIDSINFFLMGLLT